MKDRVFVDTNILIYAHDKDAGAKHRIAAVVVEETILSASELEERYLLSFWDALIIATASQAGAETLLSEDLNHGQIIEGVLIHNPLL